jgi:hypothetical protein
MSSLRTQGPIRRAARGCHTPRMRGIQYAAASRFHRWRLWNTGSPACAGDDDGGCGADMPLQPRDAKRPKSCTNIVPRETRAQGTPGARCTRGLVCKTAQKNAHEHTGSAEAIRHSLRNGFTAYSVLSPATGFLATVARAPWRELDASVGASGPHVFAVRKSALSSAAPPASIASHPAYATIMTRPSVG